MLFVDFFYRLLFDFVDTLRGKEKSFTSKGSHKISIWIPRRGKNRKVVDNPYSFRSLQVRAIDRRASFCVKPSGGPIKVSSPYGNSNNIPKGHLVSKTVSLQTKSKIHYRNFTSIGKIRRKCRIDKLCRPYLTPSGVSSSDNSLNPFRVKGLLLLLSLSYPEGVSTSGK